MVSKIATHRVLESSIPVPLFTRVLRAVLYAATVFLSFFLMLVFMTYNVSRHSLMLPALTLSLPGLSHCRRRTGSWVGSLRLRSDFGRQ